MAGKWEPWSLSNIELVLCCPWSLSNIELVLCCPCREAVAQRKERFWKFPQLIFFFSVHVSGYSSESSVEQMQGKPVERLWICNKKGFGSLKKASSSVNVWTPLRQVVQYASKFEFLFERPGKLLALKQSGAYCKCVFPAENINSTRKSPSFFNVSSTLLTAVLWLLIYFALENIQFGWAQSENHAQNVI